GVGAASAGSNRSSSPQPAPPTAPRIPTMNRNPLYAVVAFAVLGLIALFALRQPQKGESSRDRERPLAKIDAAALDTLVVTKGGATTTIKKDGAKFKVTAPVAYPADEAAAKAAFE